VLLHAITDALLGAAALGDIGRHFPDTDPSSGAPTRWCCWPRLPAACAKGWRSAMSTAPSWPRPQAGAAHSRHARAHCPGLGLTLDQVNVKAKTAEKLGPVGQLQAMEARAAALLFRKD
jgi:2-C-methyl-D-erythritol 2,4-cyclodiphosphate synthase